nr:MAG TPA: hypothetical protein [Caudoviricetes sp.]DAY58227.1 MAG TPA: hypothetical protein [Caudoviricetes sp.]
MFVFVSVFNSLIYSLTFWAFFEGVKTAKF